MRSRGRCVMHGQQKPLLLVFQFSICILQFAICNAFIPPPHGPGDLDDKQKTNKSGCCLSRSPSLSPQPLSLSPQLSYSCRFVRFVVPFFLFFPSLRCVPWSISSLPQSFDPDQELGSETPAVRIRSFVAFDAAFCSGLSAGFLEESQTKCSAASGYRSARYNPHASCVRMGMLSGFC